MTDKVTKEIENMLSEAKDGSRRAIAKLISVLEQDSLGSNRLRDYSFPLSDKIHVIGFTGAPGAGKSTLVGSLITTYRKHGESVAVLAIDPSSPFSGGAILGDRVRMSDHYLDKSVYIRSFASRGELGGLAAAIPDAMRLLGKLNFENIFIETVGVGQVEVEIVTQADTTIVVINPGWGDSIQANKAGLLEIADIFVINKADKDGLKEARRDLENMLDLTQPSDWRPPIIETISTEDKGVDELYESIKTHRKYLVESGKLSQKRKNRAIEELNKLVFKEIATRFEDFKGSHSYKEILNMATNGTKTLSELKEQIIASLGLSQRNT